MVTVALADAYFQNEVFLNDLWVNASESDKQRALKNAENMLYRYYPMLDPEKRPLPHKAIFEQAYFLMLVDETIQKAALGVKQVSVSGVSVSLNGSTYPISPEVKLIVSKELGVVGGAGSVRVGRYSL